MPWIDVAAATLILLSIVVATVTRRRSAVPVVIVGVAAISTLILGFVLEGARPVLLAMGCSALVGAAVVVWLRSGRLPRIAVATGVAVGLGCLGLAGGAWALPPVYVAAPTGVYDVGIDSEVWTDDSRDARGGDAAGETRSLPATIWYPAAGGGEPAPYLPERDRASELTEALAAQYGVPAVLFDSLVRARGNATWQGEPADGSFPVVIASPGLNSTRWFFTSWAEELASNGVVVIALDHPYDAPVAELADGTSAFSELTTTGDDARDQASADHWTSIRAADMRAVIDHLRSDQVPLPALKSADTTEIIAAGHSLGGAAALEAARLDDRIAGVVDIDGMPRSPDGAAPVRQPVLAVVAGDADPNPEYDAALDSLLANGTGAVLELDGVAHFAMVDVGLMIAPLPGITGTRGAHGPTAAAQATLRLIEAVTTGTALDADSLAELGGVSTSSDADSAG
ncbi:hypothetical protein GCM10027413_14090 [Conyzicola nivalis]|uniref:Platelet-activating factor acetylhydrolase n=1 Tax=Conyzicola nivalis TaxID=1477021 RepID=A0A916WGR5_9MICO|nr:alpha/beta fold hydrolase [Conyzicola nivalis]GGA99558.1 hypothetical protein GCM10010979_12530 [Conyzicola nivalis]